jgi:hypothetical protein
MEYDPVFNNGSVIGGSGAVRLPADAGIVACELAAWDRTRGPGQKGFE